MDKVLPFRKQNCDEINIAEHIMNQRYGRASITINSQHIRWDSEHKKRLCIGKDYIAANKIQQHLTEHEIETIINLPRWDGSNEYYISAITLSIVSAAIKRSKGLNIECQCRNCATTREQQDFF